MKRLLLLFLFTSLAHAESNVALHLHITDAQSHLLPCRIHLLDSASKPQHPPALPFWRDHFICDGDARLSLPPSHYTYTIERGPEYKPLAGAIDLVAGHDESLSLQLTRLTDLTKEGYYSGDLHVHRAIDEIPLHMQAEDLHIAPTITWWNKTNPWSTRPIPNPLLVRLDGPRFYHIMGGEDERGGGALLYFGLERPLAITAASREYPSAAKFLADGRRQNQSVWIDIEKPFWWDVPIWLASGQANSIGLANNHMQRSGMYPDEAWGRRRDTKRLPDPLGNALWTQEIYYHILNCGLRIPPSAGSASGVLANPVGYNRVYVHLDGPLDYEAWWAGLKGGRCFVTNGPLLLAKANDQFPGHIFQSATGPLTLNLDLSLTSNDRVPRMEIIKDGRVDSTLDSADAPFQHRAAKITFTQSGWFLIRAIADNPRTFRFASTGPFYVEINDKPHISRASAQFFLDWLTEREAQLTENLRNANQLKEVLGELQSAKRFYQDLLSRATAD